LPPHRCCSASLKSSIALFPKILLRLWLHLDSASQALSLLPDDATVDLLILAKASAMNPGG